MPDMTITAEGAVARRLREEALSSLSIAAHELDRATDHWDEPGAEDAVDEARAGVRYADALVKQVGYPSDHAALELTAGASEIARLANEALGTLAYRLEEADKSSAALREAATVSEALEGFIAQATSAQREPVGA